MMRILVKQLVGSKYLWTHEQGLLVSEAVLRGLSCVTRVELDFYGVQVITLQFLNSAIGKLIRVLPWQDLKESVALVNFPLEQANLLEAVLIVWREIDIHPQRVVKHTGLIQDVAYWLSPFEKRTRWRRNDEQALA
ncbi:STAS-like domain-containing protein [Thermodesulfobacteriota bacterium]